MSIFMEKDLHDIIADELIEHKSLGALIYLIDAGRELDFAVDGISCFISKSNALKYVSLWTESNEQSFDSVEELLECAIVGGDRLLSVWENAKIETLF